MMTAQSYDDFLAKKIVMDTPSGLVDIPDLNPKLFNFQRDIVKWALRRGRAAIFADCGMGKTPMQLEWAKHISGKVLILAPLAVATQTVAEGVKFGIEVKYARHHDDATGKITIANYEMMDRFDLGQFNGVVLDESSILKSFDGKFRTKLIKATERCPYRLACTATPAPNDYMELGNHAEFLGVMNMPQMLATFFVHDGGDTSKWRLKGHAETPFWKWLCSWAVMLRKPSDLGYSDDGFILPPLNIHHKIIDVDISRAREGNLFALEAQTLQERREERRATICDRAQVAANMVNSNTEQWLVWCNLNKEAEEIVSRIPGAIQVQGSDDRETKETNLHSFSLGHLRVLVTKPSIAGFGMNWQNCHNVAFVGLSDSYEQFYQAVRRCWRFGQGQPVDCYVITASTEGAVVANIKRKEAEAQRMAAEMVTHMHSINEENIRGTYRQKDEYMTDTIKTPDWTMHLGDCVEQVKQIADNSIHYSIFSPPFASLYTYTNSERDMGNCSDYETFRDHFKFLVGELFRVTMDGRLLSFHCMNLPTSKQNHGFIGLYDFRGLLIQMFVEVGWIYHSEVCIWKDPVVAMQRTKALGLLHKQIKKDSTMSRQGIPDYLVTMRKPGDNPQRVTHTNDTFPVELWQQYASPIWTDINQSKTLQRESAREDKDERHVCPLQLEVIERAIFLWTNPGDVVLSPFAGIGSEGYVAIEQGRKFVGIELKKSYFDQAVANLKAAHPKTRHQTNLFEPAEELVAI